MSSGSILSYDTASEYFNYDPETGSITWKKRSGQRGLIGDDAGRIEVNGRRSIYLLGVKYSAARIAWLLHYGVDPEFTVKFSDGDVANLRIDNLEQASFRGRMRSHTPPFDNALDNLRHRSLLKDYGITLHEYREMHDKQNGVCAICDKPETYLFNGKVRALSVDHCHNHSHVRELLCAACNHMLGNARDNPVTLRAAADYIERHAKRSGKEI